MSTTGDTTNSTTGELSGVAFDWRTAQWKGSQKRYAAEHVEASFGFAHDYVTRVLGLSATTTVVRPYETYRRTQTRAVSIDSKTIEIYFTHDEIKHRKLGAIDQEVTTALAHEMIHGMREVVFPYGAGGIIERIASEGLAYMAQAYAEIDIFDAPRSTTVLHDTIPAHDLLSELYNEPHFDTDLDKHPAGEADLKSWMNDRYGRPYSWGQRLGVHCVKDMIEEHGHDFSGLIHMTAQDIIGI